MDKDFLGRARGVANRHRWASSAVAPAREEVARTIERLAEEVERLQAAQAVPAGMVLVPVEPTDEMLDAGHNQIDFDRTGQNTYYLEHPSHRQVFDVNGEVVLDVVGGSTIKQDMQDAWRAMLAASPSATHPQTKGTVLNDDQIFAAWNRASGITKAGERRLAFGREVERLTLATQAPAQAPQAEPVAQGLPDEQADAIYSQWAYDDVVKSVRDLVRLVERNRAAAWGVKLTEQGEQKP